MTGPSHLQHAQLLHCRSFYFDLVKLRPRQANTAAAQDSDLDSSRYICQTQPGEEEDDPSTTVSQYGGVDLLAALNSPGHRQVHLR